MSRASCVGEPSCPTVASDGTSAHLDNSSIPLPRNPNIVVDNLPHDKVNSPRCSLPDLMNPSKVFCIADLMLQFCREFWQSHTALSHFARSSFRATTARNVEGKHQHSLWPVPPFRWRWTGDIRPDPRRRKRLRFMKVKYELVQIIICSLNFEALGFVTEPPEHARVGACISVQQHQIIERLENLVDHFLTPRFEGRDLGRAQEKFSHIISLVQELPKCNDLSFVDLTEELMHVHRELNPYQAHFAFPKDRSEQFVSNHRCALDPAKISSQKIAGVSKPVQASRVKWENAPSFSAAEFLEPLTRAAFEDPEVLRLPKDKWENHKPGKVHCHKNELLKLIQLWDSLGACHLMDLDNKRFDEAVGLFCVPKDEIHDRLIINPKTINGRMASLSSSTKELAPGSMLALLSLPKGCAFRFSADDLTDFYYTFKVSPKRAERNSLRCIFDWTELSHLACFREELRGKQILVCLKSLAMGDNLAVEIAQQAHCQVLRQLCGAMLRHESMRYRHPIPRSDFVELLAIDDHVGIQKVSFEDLQVGTPKRDTSVFASSEIAYKKVGLIQHERKRKRNATEGIILGADFDGIRGRVMAPRSRVSILCLVSGAIAKVGSCTRKLLSVLLGCWIHILMFRRIMFSIIDDLFKQGLGLDADSVFCLSRKARNELQLLAALGPLAQSDLRASYASELFCTDASPHGGAVIAAEIGEQASQELWRHTEQRGYYTRLLSPVSEILTEKGIPSSSELEVPEPCHLPTLANISVPAPLSEGILFDGVEVFRGTGNWSEEHSRLGLVMHDGFDVAGDRLRYCDLASASVFHELAGLALRRVVREWHFGVPCMSFGTLRRPQVRSKAFPMGFDSQEPFTKYHNMLARRSCFIMTIAMLLGQYVSAEQPGNSRMYLLHCFRVLVSLGCVISHFVFCEYGSPFKKPSKWIHNKPWLIPLECTCSCPFAKSHFVVQGTFTKLSIQEFEKRCRPSSIAVYGKSPKPGEVVSSYSGAYPYKLVSSMASGSLRAKRGEVASIPATVRIRSLREIGWPEQEQTFSVPGVDPYPSRPPHEDPEWVTELSDSLPFRELFRFHFKKPGHINVNEARTFKSWMKAAAKSHPDSRLCGLLDSRVTIGAASKGRSSSYAISRILQGSMPYILGSGLYPGLLHIGSSANRADGPSRDRPVDPPTKELPEWFVALQRGRPESFDAVVQASNICKNPARWLRSCCS